MVAHAHNPVIIVLLGQKVRSKSPCKIESSKKYTVTLCLRKHKVQINNFTFVFCLTLVLN